MLRQQEPSGLVQNQHIGGAGAHQDQIGILRFPLWVSQIGFVLLQTPYHTAGLRQSKRSTASLARIILDQAVSLRHNGRISVLACRQCNGERLFRTGGKGLHLLLPVYCHIPFGCGRLGSHGKRHTGL
ncbi:hypothetical protein D3C75_1035780 [compost metagenome]